MSIVWNKIRFDSIGFVQIGLNWKGLMCKALVQTKVTVYHENILRVKAASDQSLQYLNVQLLGHTGHPHQPLQHVQESRVAFKMRAHTKLLCGYFPSNELLARHRKSDPKCNLCSAPVDSTQHILTECQATSEVLPELFNVVAQIEPKNGLLDPYLPKSTLIQFILDHLAKSR